MIDKLLSLRNEDKNFDTLLFKKETTEILKKVRQFLTLFKDFMENIQRKHSDIFVFNKRLSCLVRKNTWLDNATKKGEIKVYDNYPYIVLVSLINRIILNRTRKERVNIFDEYFT